MLLSKNRCQTINTMNIHLAALQSPKHSWKPLLVIPAVASHHPAQGSWGFLFTAKVGRPPDKALNLNHSNFTGLVL